MTIRPKVKLRLFAFFIAVILISGICGSAFANDAEDVSAQESFAKGDYEYTLLDDGTAEIINYSGDDEILTIPAELDGIRVTSLGDKAFEECDSLTEITIPDSVTSIGDDAFCDCNALNEITIPDSVTSIGEGAFSYCNVLLEITIPDSVTSIGEGAFERCFSLTEITIPDSVTSIVDYAFYECENLIEITIPNSVTSIGDDAFSFCYRLTKITIPDSVTSIGEYAFEGCTSLTEITIPDSVTNIGEYAFKGCASLTEITIPDGVTSIGVWAFDGCDNLTLTVGRGSYVEQYCESFNLPYQYSDSSDLSSEAELGKKDEEAEEDQRETFFSGNYKYALLDDGTAEIVDYFGKDEILTIPADLDGISVTSIGNEAFSFCTSLTDITIPDSVTSIGDNAFCNCDSLTEITISDSVTEIGVNPLRDCNNLFTVSVSLDHPTLTVIDGVLFSKPDKRLVYCPMKKEGAYTIPQGILEIGDGAFWNCYWLTEITIPDSVTSIGDYAFYDCESLTEITIPDSVTSIGDYVFYDCESLTEITIPDSVTSIGDFAFYDCDSLTEITIPDSVKSIGVEAFFHCESLTEITIPDSVTSIRYRAFSFCTSLTEITIPDSVTNIGDRAFECCASLTEITIPDSVASIGDMAFYECENLTLTVGRDSNAEQYCESFNLPYQYSDSSDSSSEDELEEMNEDVKVFEYVLLDDGTAEIVKYHGEDNVLTIPADLDGISVTSIGDSAFEGCTGLTEITIPNSVTEIEGNLFVSCDNLSIVSVSSDHPTLAVIDGVLFHKADKRLIFYPTTKEGGYMIPQGILEIGDRAFSGSSRLTEILIPDSVTYIGDNAFYDCTSLTEITIPNSVTEIGANPFESCDNLSTVSVSLDHPTLEVIDGVLFSKPDKILVYYPMTKEGAYTISEGVSAIGDLAFSGCSLLTEITIPDSVTSIGDEAFFDCDNLIEITIPDSVTDIGIDTFDDCDNLTLTVGRDSYAEWYCEDNDIPYQYPDSADLSSEAETEIFTSGDYYYALLDDGTAEIVDYDGSDRILTVPAELDGIRVARIGEWAFQECNRLTEITIPDGVTSIGDDAFFDCRNLIKITIPDSVTSIGFYAFEECTRLTEITIPDSVTDIGDEAFYGCGNLTLTVGHDSYAEQYCEDNDIPYQYPDSTEFSSEAELEEIDKDVNNFEYALLDDGTAEIVKYYGKQTILTVPAELDGIRVTRIGHWAFSECTTLTEVTIPDGMTSIGYMAFNACFNLTKITIPDSVTSIEYDVFRGCENVILTVDRASYAEKYCKYYDIPYQNPDSSDLSSEAELEEMDEGVKNFEYVLLDDGTAEIISYSGEDEILTIPADLDGIRVTSIGEWAFSWCDSLTEITIPDSVTSIGVYAFYTCTSLTEITIPDSVTSIGVWAFDGCDNLTLTVGRGSYVEQYCESFNLPYQYSG